MNSNILNVLIDDLHIYQLSNILQEKQEKQKLEREKLIKLANDNITVEELANAQKQTNDKEEHTLGQTVKLKNDYKGIIRLSINIS